MSSAQGKEKKFFLKFSLIVLTVLISFFTIYFISTGSSDIVVDIESVKKTEYSPKILGNLWSKKITFYHDDPYHYYSIPVSTVIPENLIDVELYRYLTNDIKIKVTDDLTYFFLLKDTDNNGKIDTVSWIIPELSEVSFSVEGKLSQSEQRITTTIQPINTQIQEKISESKTIVETEESGTILTKKPVGIEKINDVWHIWNELNDYYFNATTAEQMSNDIKNYWTRNDICFDFYINNIWSEHCSDSLTWLWYNSTDFKTYMSLTGTAELSYAGYIVDVKVEYYLEEDYPEMLEKVRLENIGNKDIANSQIKIKIHDINVNTTVENDVFRVNTTSFWEPWSGYSEYWLNESPLDLFYTQNDLISRKYEIFDKDTESWVELEWNDNYWKNNKKYDLNYILAVKKNNEPNALVDLILLTGPFNKNDVITTNFKWANAIKQNHTELYEEYNKLVDWWYDRKSQALATGTELYVYDMNMTIEMKSNGVVNTDISSQCLNENISSMMNYLSIGWKFGCFEFPKVNGLNTIRCSANRTNIIEIYTDFASEEIKQREKYQHINYSYTMGYLFVDNKTGNLTNYEYNFSKTEDELFLIGRVKLPSVLGIKNYNEITKYDTNFSYIGNSHCLIFSLPPYSNVTLNVTMLSPVINFTLPQEIVIENYTEGNSLFARMKVYPCCRLTGLHLIGEVCSQ